MLEFESRRRTRFPRRAFGVAILEGLESRLVMSAASTTTTLAVSASTIPYGQAIMLTATVNEGGGAINEGTVTFRDGSTTLGTQAVSGNVAVLTLPTLAIGTHPLSASYGGTANFLASRTDATGADPIRTSAGTGTAGNSGDGGAATSAQLDGPYGLAYDAAGNLYIADDNASVIRKVTPAGVISTVAGNGTIGYSGDGSAATSAQLNRPNAVAFDAAGNLYIADTNNSVVRMVTPAGVISTVAGNGGSGFTGDSRAATSAQIGLPVSVAVDAAGNLYIDDSSNSVIRKVAPDGIISTFAGVGTSGSSGDGGPASSAQLGLPAGIALDAAGNLYISDTVNARVRKVATNGVITTYAGTGAMGYAGDGGLATDAQIGFPQGLATDAAGNLFIADSTHSVVRKVTSSGIISTVAGNGSADYRGDGGPAASASLSNPRGLATDPLGNLSIADNGNSVVRTVTATIPVTVTPSVVAFTVTGIISPVSAGAAQSFTVTAIDANSNPFPGYTGTIHFTSSDPRAILPADVALVNGVGTFSASFLSAGVENITARDTVNANLFGTLFSIRVVPASASRYEFATTSIGQPTRTRLISVSAFDAFNNPASGYSGTATVTSPAPAYALPATITFASGFASFTSATGTVPAITVTDTTNTLLTGTIPGGVTPATLNHLNVSVSPSVAGSPSAVTVTAIDDQGNLFPGDNGAIVFTSSDAAATLPSGVSLVNGTGTFNVVFFAVGTQSLTASDVSTPTLTGTATGIVVTPATASRLAVTITSRGTGVTGSSATFTVTAFDAFGNVATGYVGPVHFASSDPSAVVPGNASLVAGQGTFSSTLGTAATQTITVSGVANPGLSGSVSFALTANQARGVVFLDINANGLLDAGESPLAGRVVFLDTNRNGTLDAGEPTATSAANGSFAFPGIAQGTAPVVEALGLDGSYRNVVDQVVTRTDGSVTVGAVPISPVAPVPVVPNPFVGPTSPDSDTLFVRSLYRAVLGREGGNIEVGGWLVALASGTTRETVAQGFVGSMEHRQQQVASMYRSFLHRGTDPSSQFWVNRFLAGDSEETVAESILNSDEYRAAHPDDASFVRGLYQDVLGRTVDSGGLAGNLAALAGTGVPKVTPLAVIAGVIGSTEAIDQAIDGFYSSYLRRPTDPGSAVWAKQLATPRGSATAVAVGILASDEFYGLAKLGKA